MTKKRKKLSIKKFYTSIAVGTGIFVLLCFFVLCKFGPKVKLQTLEDFSTLAKSTAELPEPDNKDYLKPDYTTYLKKSTGFCWAQSLLTTLSFGKIKYWNQDVFKNLLNNTSQLYEKAGYANDVILKFTPQPETHFVIFGNLHGSLHSLVRDLEELKKLGIINNNLEITNQQYYFIFTGNIINLSPFSLETLSLILNLINKNPNKAFYLLGQHENESFFDVGILKELEFKTSYQSTLKTDLVKFFSRLPLAAYLNAKPNDDTNFIRISHFDSTTNPLVTRHFYSDFLKQKTVGWQKFKINPQIQFKEFINTIGIIKAIDRSFNLIPTNGLIQLLPEKEATSWNAISCPNFTYKTLYDFNYDAFCILSFNEKSNWQITLYNQNILEKKGFNKTLFDFLKEGETKATPAGKPLDVASLKLEAETIVVGCLGDLSGSLKETHAKILEGVQLRINLANKTKELNNKIIKLINLDHQYETHIAIKQLKSLLNEYKAKILLKPMGSEILKESVPTINETNMLALFPTAVSEIFKNEKNIFFAKASFEDEARALTDYVIKNFPNKKYAIFYQNDAYGIEPLNAALKLFKEKNIDEKNILSIAYQRNSTDTKDASDKIKAFAPNCLFFFGIPKAAISLLANLGDDFFAVADRKTNKYILQLSPMDSSEMRDIIKNKNSNLIQTHIVPDVYQKDKKIVFEYAQNIAQNNLTLSPLSLEGYIAAEIFIDILQKIESPVTNEKIVKQLESIKNENFKGLKLNWNPLKRTVFSDLWLEDETGKWTLIMDDTPVKTEAQTKQETPKTIMPIPQTGAETQYTLGTLIDLSGSFKEVDEKRLKALNLRVNKANLQNEIPNLKLNLIALDHEYEPTTTKQKLTELLEQNKTLDVIINLSGTSNLKACIDIINRHNILALFPLVASGPFKNEKNVIFYSNSFEEELAVLLNYAVKKLFISKIGIFYQNDDYGNALLETAKLTLKKLNHPDNLIVAASHQRNSLVISKAVTTLRDFQPDCILSLSIPTTTNALINQLGPAIGRFLLGISLLNTSSFSESIKTKGINVIRTHIVPNVNDEKIAIAKEYKKDAVEAGIESKALNDDYAFQSYINMSIFINILKQITPPITKDKIMDKIMNFKNYEFNGLKLNYNPDEKKLANDIWIETENGEWIYSPVK